MANTNGAGAQQATPAAEIRRARQEGYPQTLPESGYTVFLRPISPERLLELGSIPNPLLADIERMLFGGLDGADDPFAATLERIADGMERNFDEAKQRETTEFIAYINRLCVAALVSPRMALQDPADDEIEPGDLPLTDRFWIYKLCTQPVEVLRSFRLQSGAAVEVGPDGETVRAKAE